MSDVAVLAERVIYLEREIREIKKELREQGAQIEDLSTNKATTILKLEQIQIQLAEIQSTVKKDSGWRGIAIEIFKLAVQVTALLTVGKVVF